MNVSFNPTVSFKSNMINDRLDGKFPEGSIVVQSHSCKPQANDAKVDEYIKKNSLPFEETLKDEDWDKTYIPQADIIHVRQKNCRDGKEYEISSDGKVVAVSCWDNPEVIREANSEIAAYFNEVKSKQVQLPTKETTPVGFSDEEFSDRLQQFKDNLKSRKWEKVYLPESDLVFIKEKKASNGIEYILNKDGTVKIAGKRTQPMTLVEANSEFAKEFNKIKSKQNPSVESSKPSLWYRIKDSIADVWKFFSMFGTMTAATAKGIFYGVTTGLGVVGAAVLLKSPSALRAGVKVCDILKNPLRVAGTTGKVVAGIASALVFATNIVMGKLQANQNTAVIEHKFNVDHRSKIA